ncbi:hypothetical protein IOC57_21300, partial [Bacillus sp. SD075]|uniref:hypothetical protein n=1 Tax=Bacillus sp. SD075 TaxID=2781732 RepID=UPI001A963961
LKENENQHQQEINQLNQSIALLSEQENHYKTEIDNLEHLIIDLKENENQHHQEIDQLNQTIALLSEQENHYKAEIDNLEQLIIDLKENEDQHQQEIGQLNQSIALLSEQENHYKVEIVNLEKTINNLKENESQHQQEIKNLTESISDLTDKETNYIQKIETINKTVNDQKEKEIHYKEELAKYIKEREKNHLQPAGKMEKSFNNNGKQQQVGNTRVNMGNFNSPINKEVIKQPNAFRFSIEPIQQKTTNNNFSMQTSHCQTLFPPNKPSYTEIDRTQQNYYSGIMSSYQKKDYPDTKLNNSNTDSLDIFYKKHPLYNLHSAAPKTAIDPFKNFRKH